jgi:hypothetical protein
MQDRVLDFTLINNHLYGEYYKSVVFLTEMLFIFFEKLNVLSITHTSFVLEMAR